jgi:hypothetical protein
MRVYTTTCGALSVIFFALCQSFEELFPHGAAASPSHGDFTDLLQSAAGHTVLMVVAIFGVTIGGGVYVVELRTSRHR